MTWNYSPTIKVAGVSYTTLTINAVTIEYGRSRIWDNTRPGYARVDIVNTTNAVLPFKITDELIIQVKNASGVTKTLFTGILTDVGGAFYVSDTAGGVGVATLTAVAPMAEMARTVVGRTAYPQETDAARIQRILTESGVTIDTIDAAIYTFSARTASPTDAFNLANNYANSVLGCIYETTDGKVGYANEGRRRQTAITNGFTSIPKDSIIINSINSNQTITDVMNLTNVIYSAGTSTFNNASSQTTYGVIGASLTTELVNQADADTIAKTLLNLRAQPQTNLSQFSVRMLDPTLTTTQINNLVAVYFGQPVTVTGLPNTIYNGTYEGYIEGWNWSFSPANITLNLKTSQEAYSYRNTRWQEVSAALTWNAVTPTLQWQNYD